MIGITFDPQPLHFGVVQHSVVQLWTMVIFTTIEDPCSRRDDENYSERRYAIVHVAAGDRQFWREDKQYCCKKGPSNTDLGM